MHVVSRLSAGCRRGLLFAALALVAAATSVSARQVSKAATLACGGTGPQRGTIVASERSGVVSIKVKADALVPGQAATCGYSCGQVFSAGPELPCGTVGATGRLTGAIELPLTTCFGFIPFFTTPTTGKCVLSTVPR